MLESHKLTNPSENLRARRKIHAMSGSGVDIGYGLVSAAPAAGWFCVTALLLAILLQATHVCGLPVLEPSVAQASGSSAPGGLA